MTTTSFTTRIDPDLKARLEKVARSEDRSASYLANRAIETMVREREETNNLVKTGLELIEAGAPTVSEQAIDSWLKSGGNDPFPEPDTFR